MGGQYQEVGSSNDVKFVDPTGQYMTALNGLQGTTDPNAYMQQFLGQSGALSSLVSGAQSPLQQSLNARAAEQARLGGESSLASMPGLRNSGAGMAAFGNAYAQPFADVQNQLGQQQLNLTGNLWSQAMGANAQQYSNLQNIYGNLVQGTGSMYQPTYEYQKGFGDYAMDLAGLAINGYSAFANPAAAAKKKFGNSMGGVGGGIGR